MTEYVAYFRVSTARQGQSGLGLEAQRSLVEAFTDPANIVAEFTEIESGRKDDRPVIAEALAHAKKTGATLLIAKIDRLARDVHFVSGLLKSGVPIVCADMPEASTMVLQMLSVFAEYEAKAISDRTKAALKAAKERGVKLGANNPVIQAANVAGAIAKGDRTASEIMGMIGQHCPNYQELSYRKIASILDENGCQSSKGKALTHKQVASAIQRHTASHSAVERSGLHR
ncbi:recombinase family protein [Agrobacterium leguminum]|uniref:Resolvase/invertase-type recombinase catalytic domain-containing protein n=1 Tax=Agrobacterium deltaense NCPPB 1641 TaxID=1183425 RepID=A0A1S7U2C7_9HYPH|nr:MULTISPECIES: recombinase family protein [Agrobacterium]WFS67421.1 recombinase family protein [Agrobacterium leguminum]CVI60982.1 conserved hypothetical protein [Agrobacterium deltaense NCPPB 1641]